VIALRPQQQTALALLGYKLWLPRAELAALGLTREAAGLLDWVDHHRTAVGALPEKVRADGTPAGPAPLAWTCALVLLAARETV